MDYSGLYNAVLGQAAAVAPTDNPLGASFAPEISSMNNASFAAPISAGITAGQGYKADVAVAEQKAREKAALEAAVQREKDLNDPSKYQQIPKDDGGYTFLDPDGNEISAFTYSRVVNKSPDKILSDSQNPIDQGFVNDYKNLQDFMTAVRNNDTEAVDAALKANPELEKFKKDLPGLIQRFKEHYPTVFGGTQNGNQSVNSSYIPSLRVAQANANSLDNTSTTIGQP